MSYNADQDAVLQELNQIREMLTEAVKSGEFNILTAVRMLRVIDVKIGGDERPGFSCPMGSVPLRGDDSQWAKCVLCPVGTFFNVVNEVCESCSQGSYQPEEGRVSCLVCPNNTSTKVVNAKHPEDCQGNGHPASMKRIKLNAFVNISNSTMFGRKLLTNRTGTVQHLPSGNVPERVLAASLPAVPRRNDHVAPRS